MIKDLLNIEVVATLNQAFCQLHHSMERCSNATYVRFQCAKVIHPATCLVSLQHAQYNSTRSEYAPDEVALNERPVGASFGRMPPASGRH